MGNKITAKMWKEFKQLRDQTNPKATNAQELRDSFVKHMQTEVSQQRVQAALRLVDLTGEVFRMKDSLA